MVEMSRGAATADDTSRGAPSALAEVEFRKGRQRAPLAARIGLAGLTNIREGRLTVKLPDGRTLVFGSSGGLQAEMAVHRWRFFGRLLRASDIGAGESYVDGDWSTPDLVALTRYLMSINNRDESSGSAWTCISSTSIRGSQ